LLQSRLELSHLAHEDLGMSRSREPIHVTVACRADDPRRSRPDPPGVVVHYVPELHPDDVTVVHGIPCTSVSRTLVDLADVMEKDELRGCFERARELGMLDLDAVEASLRRAEWRRSLATVREVLDELRAP
jgi:hypothetical protein